MAPLVRRTWAPRGQRPVLHQQGRHRDKVSLAAALWWTPGSSRRLGLCYQALVNGYFNNYRTAAFLERLLHILPGRLIVVWDGGTMHKGDPIREVVERFGPRLTLERLPPYAPMLNPVEHVWSWLKNGRLCNYAPADAPALHRRAVRELESIRDDPEFLLSMWHASELPLPRALLI
jgi:transposase